MKLYNLIECENSLKELEISGITCNSKEVKEGFAFVCIRGSKVDGHIFAKDVLEKGAAVIICEEDLGIKNQIIVSYILLN